MVEGQSWAPQNPVELDLTIRTSCLHCFPIDYTPYGGVTGGYNFDETGQVPNMDGLEFGGASRKNWQERHKR